MRIIFLSAMLLALTACNKEIKHKLGVLATPPDEYAVTRHDKLEIPEKFEIVEPGEASMQNKKVVAKNKDLSKAEADLLSQIKGE